VLEQVDRVHQVAAFWVHVMAEGRLVHPEGRGVVGARMRHPVVNLRERPALATGGRVRGAQEGQQSWPARASQSACAT